MDQRPQEMQRYFTEHYHIPFLFYTQPPEFLRILATRRESVVAEIFNFLRTETDPDGFLVSDFEVWTERRGGRYCAAVLLPEPQVPLRCSMIGFSMKEDGTYPIYRTIEQQQNGRHCLCGWTKEHSRLNLGGAPDDAEGMRKVMMSELESSDTETIEDLLDLLNGRNRHG